MPHLNATIISLSQDMDLGTGSMANFMLLRLPNGKVVRALIGDDAAQDIVSLSVVSNGATIPSPSPVATDDAVDVATHVFGGEGMASDLPCDEELSEPVVPPSPPPPPPPPPRQVRRPKSVSKDEMGYPVVHMDGGVDPREMTSTRDQDEDGVGQI